ncbi:hypothetical protein BGZ72_000249 [Mortierella alpina]|nr:hypothetical protein BGZ72_000249 [Mortierella alpina]
MAHSRRVAIVTGASRGIGRAIALRLAKDGFNVVVNDISSAEETRKVIEDIEALRPSIFNKRQQHVRAIAVQGDVGKIADDRRLMDQTITAFGRLDILVLNAAWAKQASIRELTEDLFTKAIDTNVKGPLFLSKLAQPYLVKAQKERDTVKEGVTTKQMSTSRRVAIVTGGSRGIGRSIALRLAKDGFNVVVNYQSSAAKAQEVVHEIAALHVTRSDKNQEHVRAIAVQGDSGNTADGKRLLDETIAAFGRLDVVVLNAAWVNVETVREVTEETFSGAFDINVKGPLFFAKMAQPHLERAQKEAGAVQFGGSPLGGSRIISISSILSTMSHPQDVYLVYAMTKGALDQMTRVLARDQDFGAKGITVNGVAPGPIDTEALRQLPEAVMNDMVLTHPQKRMGQVDDIADVVSFLASNDSKWVNGQTIGVSGGFVV